jgi:hypothetical protein
MLQYKILIVELLRLTRLLPIASKVFEELLLKRLLPMVENNINIHSSVGIQAKALNNRIDTSNHTKSK